MSFELAKEDIERADTKSSWFCHNQNVSYEEFEDYMAVGRLGLVKAARDYTPQKDSAFFTYAHYRILGELKDYSRSFYVRHSKQPKPQTHAISLQELIETGWEPSADGLEGRTINKELCWKLLATLETRDEQIMRLYFFEERGQAEIGKIFNYTESRISQIIKKNLARLRIRAINLS